MTSTEKRLEAATAELTARERAVLLLRAWCEGEEPDARIRKHMPAEQREDCQRVVQAVEQASGKLWEMLAFALEWLHQADFEMAWLQCLSELRGRERHLAAALAEDGWELVEGSGNSTDAGTRKVTLARMTPPGRGFRRDLPLLWGQLVHEQGPPPVDWDAAITDLTNGMKETVELRAQEIAADEMVVEAMAALLGESLVHKDVRRALDGFRAKVFDLHAAIQPFTGPFDLPEPSSERIERARGLIDWDVLDPRPKDAPKPFWGAREYMKADEREALEEFEAEAKASFVDR